jgi:hypothetical protein
VFVEVKRPGEALGDHQEQLLRYAFTSGIRLAALTNGLSWWFYLPLQEGSWEERKFDSLEISRNDLSVFSERISNYLSKDSVSYNRAVEIASNRYKELREMKLLDEAFPRAWSLVVNEDNQDFLELLNRKIEEICGYRASKEKLARNIYIQKLGVRTASKLPNGALSQTSVKANKKRNIVSRDLKVNYWLIPFKNPDALDRLLVEEKIWAFGNNTPGRKAIKPGDWACFYLSGKGVVAHAQVASNPAYLKHPSVKDLEKYPWVFQLTDVRTYDRSPVRLDGSIRRNLEAFMDRDPDSSWGWFVQSNHRISEGDFKQLIR